MADRAFQFDDIDPEEAVLPALDGPAPGTLVRTTLAEILPKGFNLPVLLSFLPDVRLKQALQQAADAALAIAVSGAAGLVEADTARSGLKQQIADILRCFNGSEADPGPASLAYQLHSRITGLRADFVKAGEDALKVLDPRIVLAQRALDAEVAAERRKAQEAADAEVRAAVAAAAQEAERNAAPPEIVQALKEEAKVAQAPPVAPAPRGGWSGGGLAKSAVVEAWKARPIGTPAEQDPHPKMEDLTEAQRRQVLETLRAVVDGKAPMSFFDIAWGRIDKRAEADKTTFSVPGLEAFDAGGVRGKGRR